MDHAGHVGIGLLLAAIVIHRFDEPTSLWFTGLVIPASLLPDIDRHLPYVLHQGRIHTYSVMLLVSIIVGVVCVGAYAVLADRTSGDNAFSVPPARVFSLVTSAFVLGTFSHVTLDVIAYRESFHGPPVEPLWPVTGWVPRINVFPSPAPLWNDGFLLLGVAAWTVAYLTTVRVTSNSERGEGGES